MIQDYNQNRKGRILRKNCKDEAVDYDRLSIRRTILYWRNNRSHRKVKILHYDINGWILCLKWFTDAKSLKPEFEKCKITHELSKQTLILLMSTLIQIKIKI